MTINEEMHSTESLHKAQRLPQNTAYQPMLPIYPEPPAVRPLGLNRETRFALDTFAAAIIEVIAGIRNPHQLFNRVSPPALRAIQSLRLQRGNNQLRIRSTHLQATKQNDIEMALKLTLGTKTRAAAIRLIRTSAGWYCTNLEIALRPPVIIKAGGPCPAAILK